MSQFAGGNSQLSVWYMSEKWTRCEWLYCKSLITVHACFRNEIKHRSLMEFCPHRVRAKCLQIQWTTSNFLCLRLVIWFCCHSSKRPNFLYKHVYQNTRVYVPTTVPRFAINGHRFGWNFHPHNHRHYPNTLTRRNIRHKHHQNASHPPESNSFHDRSAPTPVTVQRNRKPLKFGKGFDFSDKKAGVMFREMAANKAHITVHDHRTKEFCAIAEALNFSTEFVR